MPVTHASCCRHRATVADNTSAKRTDKHLLRAELICTPTALATMSTAVSAQRGVVLGAARVAVRSNLKIAQHRCHPHLVSSKVGKDGHHGHIERIIRSHCKKVRYSEGKEGKWVGNLLETD